jgi:hypothetical protein
MQALRQALGAKVLRFAGDGQKTRAFPRVVP